VRNLRARRANVEPALSKSRHLSVTLEPVAVVLMSSPVG
jgi:hypothetical protein